MGALFDDAPAVDHHQPVRSAGEAAVNLLLTVTTSSFGILGAFVMSMRLLILVAVLVVLSPLPATAESAATPYWACGVVAREREHDQSITRNEVQRFFRLAQSKEPETLGDLGLYLVEPEPDFWRGYELASITGELFIQMLSRVGPDFNTMKPAERQAALARVAADFYDELSCKQLLALSGT